MRELIYEIRQELQAISDGFRNHTRTAGHSAFVTHQRTAPYYIAVELPPENNPFNREITASAASGHLEDSGVTWWRNTAKHRLLQGSPANAKISARRSWYIGHSSKINHLSLAFFTVTPSTTNICSHKTAK